MLISYLGLCHFLFVLFLSSSFSRVIRPTSCIEYYMIPKSYWSLYRGMLSFVRWKNTSNSSHGICCNRYSNNARNYSTSI